MALSDELLAKPERLLILRDRVSALVTAVGARAGFLIDEQGAPFASVGQVEFALPHPIAGLHDGDALLGALVGEGDTENASNYIVQRVGERALLAIFLDAPAKARKRRQMQRIVRKFAPEIEAMLH